ncbi:PB1 domain-containing protein [Citrus sinensis]|uniref:PB1 domain-containing protein n=1 Tax=Citrus sinensis TaxID=2711 RepID=A0ACB8KNT7_CITSI|nr:PB1 domain-containing protein [Citrus sinensis]
MENYSYSSYPDSGDSSPRSREIDCENQSWDEPLANYKVKFMCSYGGKIQPRQHDNQLAYVGGDTKILAVERNIKFGTMMAKLSALCSDDNICFKYQLPGEDLDALISVTNDEDLEHMMLEYDRLYRASAKPARLRLFLFALNPKSSPAVTEPKSERQWFVDALNSVQIQTLEGSSPSAAAVSAANPDFLFGFDKPKLVETAAVPPEVVGKDVTAGSDCGSEDRHVIGDPVIEIQRQELQRLNISGLEQANQIPRVSYAGAGQKMTPPPPGAIPMPMQMQIPAASYLPERQVTAGTYQTEQQPVYYLHAAPGTGGLYSAPSTRPPASQAYYGVQRIVQEQPMYNLVPASAPAPGSIQQQQAKIGGYSEGVGVVQVGYDGAGRQVYYTTTTAAAGPPAGGMMAQYQALNQEGKVVVNAKPPQTSLLSNNSHVIFLPDLHRLLNFGREFDVFAGASALGILHLLLFLQAVTLAWAPSLRFYASDFSGGAATTAIAATKTPATRPTNCTLNSISVLVVTNCAFVFNRLVFAAIHSLQVVSTLQPELRHCSSHTLRKD